MYIGVFDSGIGGALIANKIRQQLPQYQAIFIADSKHFPYGNKSQRFILNRSLALTQELVNKNCKLIVVACNSATTNTISKLRNKFPQIQFVGIEPPAKPVVRLTKTGHAAIMGTTATIKSQRLKELISSHSGHNTSCHSELACLPNWRDSESIHTKPVKIHLIPCPGLAEKIESMAKANRIDRHSEFSSESTSSLFKKEIKKFLDKPIKKGVDTIGLACTHYPYLLPQLKKLYPQVNFYDPADAVVKQVKRIVKPKKVK